MIVVAVIVFAGIKVQQAVVPPPIMVSVAEDKPHQAAGAAQAAAARASPRLDMAPMPEIDIAPEAPTQSIHIPVAPPPAAPAAPAEPAPSVAPAETQQSYLARLLGYLNRYKHYPPAARAARIQGVVMLHFVMDKTGHVTTFEISRSSGMPALDEEGAGPDPARPAAAADPARFRQGHDQRQSSRSSSRCTKSKNCHTPRMRGTQLTLAPAMRILPASAVRTLALRTRGG